MGDGGQHPLKVLVPAARIVPRRSKQMKSLTFQAQDMCDS